MSDTRENSFGWKCESERWSPGESVTIKVGASAAGHFALRGISPITNVYALVLGRGGDVADSLICSATILVVIAVASPATRISFNTFLRTLIARGGARAPVANDAW